MAVNLVLDNGNFSGNPPVLENVLVAAGLRVGSVGVASGGNVACPTASVGVLTLQGVPSGSSPEVSFNNSPLLPLLPQEYVIANGNSTGGGVQEGCLQVFTYNNGGFVGELVNTFIPPRGVVGPPVVAGTQAIWGLTSGAQAGTATIPLGAATVAVANTAVGAGTIIMLSGNGAADATALYFNPVITPGTGFAINTNANATAAKAVNWFIVRY
jgi:hypothetical protein